MKMSRRVILNVGGIRSEILLSTLDRLPHSRLGRLIRCDTHESIMSLCDDYSADGNEYFFDRHPRSINSILNFYRTGKLHLIDEMCVLAFCDDLEYWRIDDWHMETCCMNKYHRRRDQVLDELQKEASDLRELCKEEFGDGPYAQIRKKIWDTLEMPSKNLTAKVCSLLRFAWESWMWFKSLISSLISLFTDYRPDFDIFHRIGDRSFGARYRASVSDLKLFVRRHTGQWEIGNDRRHLHLLVYIWVFVAVLGVTEPVEICPDRHQHHRFAGHFPILPIDIFGGSVNGRLSRAIGSVVYFDRHVSHFACAPHLEIDTSLEWLAITWIHVAQFVPRIGSGRAVPRYICRDILVAGVFCGEKRNEHRIHFDSGGILVGDDYDDIGRLWRHDS